MPIPMMKNKPYTIAMVGKNDAEVNLYGEVVQSHPTDWWTGEKVPGNFIALDTFLKDLEELNTKDNITVHINSVGGDFFAGLAIYNRLRTMDASITTVNDSLAASAGSIIFMAGDKGKRKVHAASNLMVHGVMGFLYGYYNVSDLKGSIKTLQAHDKALLAVYMEATGLDEETVKKAISKDTYMTGQEAVDAGWADEVISGGESMPNVQLSPDRNCLMTNGMAVAAHCFGKLPDSIPQMTEEEWVTNYMQPEKQVDIKQEESGGNDMKIQNIEQMREAFPEYVAQIEAVARMEGAAAERTRIQSIEAIQDAVGDMEMVRNAKYGEKPLTAELLAFQAMQKQSAIGANMLGNMKADANSSGAAEVVAAPAANEEMAPDSPEAMMAAAKADAAAFKKMKGGK